MFKRKFVLFACCAVLSVSCKRSNVAPAPQPPVIVDKVKPVTMQFEEVLSGTNEAYRLQQSLPASDFTATGLYMPPGAILTLILTQLEGSITPELLIGTYSRYENKINPQNIQLSKGKNTITGDSKGGMIYIRFITEETAASKVKIEFTEGFRYAPLYILGQTSLQDWQKQLDTLPETPDVTMISKGAIMVFSRAKAALWKEKNQSLVLQGADNILDAEAAISGLDASAPEHNRNIHKILMTETNINNAYMFATWYRTAYKNDAAAYAFTEALYSSDGWGPWHELGHMHQQEDWTWEQLGEVTVNIYSLAAQRSLGFTPSRLHTDNVWAEMLTFFNLANRDFNDDNQASVWVRLCIFEQLRLAFGDGFYIALHKQTRLEKPELTTTGEKMRYFMLKACHISGKNLGRFFKTWGFRVSENVYAEIDALGLPLPSTDPSTLTD